MAAPAWLAGAAAVAQRTLGAVVPNLLTAASMRQTLENEQARVDAEVNAGLAYAGAFPDPLRVRPGDIRDTVRINLIRPIVHATVAFLFGDPPIWDLAGDGESDPDVDTPAEAWMRDTLTGAGWPTRLLELSLNGAIYGTAYWRIREPDAAHPAPYLQVLPPECMSVQTDPRDIDVITGYCYQRTVPDPATGQPVLWRQRWRRDDDGATWTMQEEQAAFDGAAWRPTGPPVVWPYSWCPILHCQNLPAPNAVYGDPDITPTAIETNLAINLSASATARIERHHASPRVWVTGMDGKTLNLGIGGIIYLDNPDSKIGQLVPAVDGQSGAAFRAELHQAICEDTGTPSIILGRTDGGRMSSGDPSGVALRTKLWPLLNKTAMKQQTYGPLLTETLRRLWELGGWGPACRAVWTWHERIPGDPLTERQALQIDAALGASEQTILEKLGYDPAVERAQRAAAAGDALTATQAHLQQIRAQQLLAQEDTTDDPQP